MTGPARSLALLAGLAAFAASLAGCGANGDGDPPADARIRVVATTTVLADLVVQVGGEHVSVESLVPQGGEVHTFDPSPGDVARIAGADLVVGNGLGLDAWLEALVRGAGGDAAVVELAASVDPSDYLVDEGRPNPHLWLDPGFGAAYGQAIGDALGRVDARRAASFEAAAESYAARLRVVEDELHERLEAVPTERRRIVSFHDAFPYFARAFDLELVGTILEAPGQDPSAGELAALIDEIRTSGAVAVVSEVQFRADLAATVAEETGARVVEDLYTDTLGDPPVDTYEGLLRWDVERLVEVLRP